MVCSGGLNAVCLAFGTQRSGRSPQQRSSVVHNVVHAPRLRLHVRAHLHETVVLVEWHLAGRWAAVLSVHRSPLLSMPPTERKAGVQHLAADESSPRSASRNVATVCVLSHHNTSQYNMPFRMPVSQQPCGLAPCCSTLSITMTHLVFDSEFSSQVLRGSVHGQRKMRQLNDIGHVGLFMSWPCACTPIICQPHEMVDAA